MRALQQALVICGKEWRLLLRNPHGLAVLFLMPALFLLVMSFALKNTLTSEDIVLPSTGWVIEDQIALATTWSNDWIERKGGQRFASRALLLEALRARQVQAGVIVQDGWVDAQGSPRTERIELWLSNRIQPASEGACAPRSVRRCCSCS